MKNISEFSNMELFCNVGLYQDISVKCSDFIHDDHEEYDYDNGYERKITVYRIKHSQQFKRLVDFMLDSQNIYMFCPICNKPMSFQMFPVKMSEDIRNDVLESYTEDSFDEEFSTSEQFKMSEKIKKIAFENRLFDKVIRCTHDSSHVFKFSFLLQRQGQYPDEFLTLTKIGQYPSINDFSGEHIKSYQKLLNEYKKEYTKALGLFSAGIGIGSFVYLRRVIEFLLEKAFQRAESAGALTREDYMKETVNDRERNRRLDEKIKLLKDYLPQFMVENAVIYNILSKGIHELDEETCKNIFPVLQKSIELILDEELAMQQKILVTEEAQKDLNKIKSQLSK